MTYVPTDWVDGVTPVDAAHMDNLEAGVVGAVEKDSVVTAPTRIVASKLLVGDAQPAFKIQGDGRIDWGQGGATALDSNLYRPNPGQLRTDGILNVGGRLFVRVGTSEHINIGENGGIRFGPAEDTNLYRSAANTLKTDGYLAAGINVVANVGAANQVYIGGVIPQIVFGSAGDTNLYRAAANVLKTDDSLEFQSAFSSYVADGVFGATALPSKLFTPANNELRFGYSDLGSGQYFPSLGFRVAPTAYNGALEIFQARRTDEGNNRFSISHDGHLNWGSGASALDTNLYRSAAGALKTDGQLILGYNSLYALQFPGTAGGMVWNGEFYLARADATGIGFSAGFQAGNDIVARSGYGGGANTAMVRIGQIGGPNYEAGILFGNLSDTNLYRAAANELKTDDLFRAAGLVGGGQITQTGYIGASDGPLGNCIEWGHTNNAGYRSHLGNQVGNGAPWLVFNGEGGTNDGTFRTRGIRAAIIRSNNTGGLEFLNVASASADNQSPVTLATLSNAGVLNAVGGLQINGVPVGGSGGQRARVVQTAGTPLAGAGTYNLCAFASETFDNDGIHDNVTNNSRLVCKTAGTYRIYANMHKDATDQGFAVRMRLNGTTVIAESNYEYSHSATSVTLYTEYDLAVNDYVEILAASNGGSGNTVVGSHFGMSRL